MKTASAIVITLFWIAMSALLVQRELFPAFLKRSPITYRTLLTKVQFPSVERFELRLFGRKVGTLRTEYLRDPNDKGCRILNTLSAQIPPMKGIASFMKSPETALDVEFSLSWSLWLDERFRHTKLSAEANAPALDLTAQADGNFNGEGDLFLTYTLKMQRQEVKGNRVMACPPNTLFGLGTAGFGLFENLHVGKKWSVTSPDLSSLLTGQIRTQSLNFVVESLSQKQIDAKPEEIFTVRAELAGQGDIEIWIGKDGRVLRSKQSGFEFVRLP